MKRGAYSYKKMRWDWWWLKFHGDEYFLWAWNIFVVLCLNQLGIFLESNILGIFLVMIFHIYTVVIEYYGALLDIMVWNKL